MLHFAIESTAFVQYNADGENNFAFVALIGFGLPVAKDFNSNDCLRDLGSRFRMECAS